MPDCRIARRSGVLVPALNQLDVVKALFAYTRNHSGFQCRGENSASKLRFAQGSIVNGLELADEAEVVKGIILAGIFGSFI